MGAGRSVLCMLSAPCSSSSQPIAAFASSFGRGESPAASAASAESQSRAKDSSAGCSLRQKSAPSRSIFRQEVKGLQGCWMKGPLAGASRPGQRATHASTSAVASMSDAAGIAPSAGVGVCQRAPSPGERAVVEGVALAPAAGIAACAPVSIPACARGDCKSSSRPDQPTGSGAQSAAGKRVRPVVAAASEMADDGVGRGAGPHSGFPPISSAMIGAPSSKRPRRQEA
jgi:hypothetical protein